MDPGVRKVLQNNTLMALGKVLNDIDDPDKDLVGGLAAGLPIYCDMPQTGVCPHDPVPAVATEEDLMRIAGWAQVRREKPKETC